MKDKWEAQLQPAPFPLLQAGDNRFVRFKPRGCATDDTGNRAADRSNQFRLLTRTMSGAGQNDYITEGAYFIVLSAADARPPGRVRLTKLRRRIALSGAFDRAERQGPNH